MALIKCKECGKEISDKAAACIHCGCPIEKEDENKNSIQNDESIKEDKGKEIVDKNVGNIEVSKNDSNNNSNNNGCVVFFAVVLLIGAVIFGIVTGLKPDSNSNNTNKDNNKQKISGCYYITDSYTKRIDTTISLCVSDENVSYTYKGNTVSLYTSWIGDDHLYIKNSYKETLFDCQLDLSDNNNMKCKSYNKMLGTGTWIWKKS